MAKDKGWLKLPRDIDDLDIMGKNEPYDKVHAYIDLLKSCNYEDKPFTPRGGETTIIIHRGQFHTSLGNLASKWKWSLNKVRGYLKRLHNLDLAHTEAHTFGITITLVKYEVEGGDGISKGISNGISDGTANGTSNGISNGIRLKKDKNSKNTKKEKEIKKAAPRFNSLWGDPE